MNNLDKIIELTHGKWPEDPVLLDGIYTGEFTNQQYDKRLKELTGRPDVKDWPEWAEALTQDKNGEFIAWDYTWGMTVSPDSDRWEVMEKTISITDSLGYGKTITSESWKNSLITREEAEMVDKEMKKWIPEPGTECEYRIADMPWGKCDFIGRKSSGSVVIMDDGEYMSHHPEYIEFRAIESSEDKAINQITQLVAECPSTLSGCKAIAKAIYSRIKNGEIKID